MSTSCTQARSKAPATVSPSLHGFGISFALCTAKSNGLTVAESFRDMGAETDGPRDILFFIDNSFRFTQAGSEVSALLGRMLAAVGYQPTLATEMGAMQERITSQ